MNSEDIFLWMKNGITKTLRGVRRQPRLIRGNPAQK
jgi:hypothetical protein